MRPIVVFNNVTADGFFAGPRGEIEWFGRDPAAMAYAREAVPEGDTLLFGRVTYELMASYWPTAKDDDPVITETMNERPKIVFSRTLERADWKNTTILRRIDRDEILELKRRPGKGMVVLGSGSVVSRLAQLGLVDEFALMVNPVVIGAGRAMLAGLERPVELRRLEVRPIGAGSVLLRYAPAG